MKLKHIMTTLGLALVLGVGVGAGLASKQQVKEAKADGTTTLYCKMQYSWWTADNAAIGVYYWQGESNNSWPGTRGTAVTGAPNTWSFEVPSNSDGLIFTRVNSSGAVSDWGAKTKNLTIPTDGKNLYTITSSSAAWGDPGVDGEWSTFVPPAVTYTVTKHAVVNGVLEGEAIGSDTVEENAVYDVPDRINKSGYHFAGWYTTQACDVAFEGATVTGNFDIYAKYVDIAADSYIYYVTGSESVTGDYIYTYGGDEQFGSWPGTAITAVVDVADVHGVLAFQGTQQKVYKIPFMSTADTNVILNNGKDGDEKVQTPNMTLTAGAAYWFSDVSDANVKAGKALDLLLKVEAARNAVVASEGILAYSVCGIAPAQAAELYNEYYALEDKDVYVDSTTTWTYNGAYSDPAPEETQISYYDVMQQLKAIAVKGGQEVSGAKVNTTVNSNNSMIIIVLVSSMSLIAISALFIIRRRRAMR